MAKTKEFYFKSHDQHRLYAQVHRTQRPRAALVLVHGFNEHLGRYGAFVKYFAEQYNIYQYDQRGHGRSDGVRFFVEDFSEYTKDLRVFLDLVRNEEKERKIFLLGHSMGGQIVLNYLAENPGETLSGFMTTGANIETRLKINPVKRFLGRELSKYLPRMTLAHGINPKWLSHDRTVVKSYETDPFMGKSITTKLATVMLDNQDILPGLAPRIFFPAFLLHGGSDMLCHARGTAAFFEKLGSTDKELKIYDGLYHELLNEVDREMVLADIASWLKHRVR